MDTTAHLMMILSVLKDGAYVKSWQTMTPNKNQSTQVAPKAVTSANMSKTILVPKRGTRTHREEGLKIGGERQISGLS